MGDRTHGVNELKRQFCSDESRFGRFGFFGFVEWWLKEYEEKTDPLSREEMLTKLWTWSLLQPWAWDALVEVCHRTWKRGESLSPLLVQFLVMAGRRSARGRAAVQDTRLEILTKSQK